MKVKTQLAHELETAGHEVKKDISAKNLLKYRLVLAHILKGCVQEYENVSIKDIAEKYIQKEPFDENREIHGFAAEKIVGQNGENGTATEGTRLFDLIFYAYLPGEKEQTRFIVNIEPQNKFNTGYPLVKRGFYYDARLISAQYGTEFKNSDYGGIKKVFSIWICLNPTEKYQNTLTRYHITEENIVGNIKAKKSTYDLMEVIIVGLHEETENRAYKSDFINMLSVLFSTTIQPDKKEEILDKKYGIPFTEEYRKEVNDMCSLSEVFSDKIRAQLEKEMKPQLDQAKAEVEKAKAEVDDLKTETENLKTETENLKTEAENLKTEAENLKTETENLKTETENLKNERQKAMENLRVLGVSEEDIKKAFGIT